MKSNSRRTNGQQSELASPLTYPVDARPPTGYAPFITRPSNQPTRHVMHRSLRLFFAVLLLLTFAAPALAGGPWTGKMVILNKPGVKIGELKGKGQNTQPTELTLL